MVNNPELSLNEFIPYILSVLSNEISQNIASQYEQGFGIDLHQWRVMAILGEHSALSAVEVSHKTAMDKVAVSRAVKKLLAQKLVVREISEFDKRRSILSLSEDGILIYKQVVPLAKNYETKLLQTFTKTELKQLVKLLQKLKHSNDKLIAHAD